MKPSVLIELDRPRNLRLTTNALVKVEEVLGKPLSEFGEACGLKEMRALLWAGLQHEDKSLSLEDAGDLIDTADFEYVSAKVGEAINLSLGNKDKLLEQSDPN